ncbi:unnamed protein product [Spirodela intermedia]|uniref:Exostosin GT47 domain-containing protein n=1 Tax=Spirodela intermedia TaxID=51605 RepID=A0A7I8ICF3_SPIIN|nr:unnamed protein product [Spirodela intermedia]CAA6655044.1 unnamed protein product [Spirodela intermedia]
MALAGFRHRLLQFLVGVIFLRSALSSSPSRLLTCTPLIFAYPDQPWNSSGFRPGSPAALFHASLMRSRFLTLDPEEAHLFYLSFPGEAGPRSIARSIRSLRSELPFWNRTLGADHFYISEEGIGDSSDRNLVELRKNSIHISTFPAAPGRFIPHKDLTLPSPISASTPPSPKDSSFRFLAYYDGVATDHAVLALLDELRKVPDVIINSGRPDPTKREQSMSACRFCLFFYGLERDPRLGEALKSGCVPVVVSGGPILELPFSDVLRWSEIALFVPLRGGAEEIRRTMDLASGETHARMRATAIQASTLFRWDLPESPTAPERPHDAFTTVLFQLWRRRHAIRYVRWGERGSSLHARSDF